MQSLIHWLTVVGVPMSPNAIPAYIGPGAGISALGSIVALIGAVLFMILGFVWYPIKRLWKRMKRRNASPTENRPNNQAQVSPPMDDQKQSDNQLL